MSDTCNNQCEGCAEDCNQRTAPQDFMEKPHAMSHIKKVIGVVSGKGGVGKSLVTSLLAVEMARRGHSTAILDADITGPSIPRAFGVQQQAMANDAGLLPVVSKTGVRIMSLNLLMKQETDPVVWRGPVIAGLVKQFWTEVIWGEVDFMFVDMPPGTGDVPLTVYQSIPLDGIVVVSTPQDLVGMVVEKAVNMAKLMNIPLLGLVENMSYLECPGCKEQIAVFGESRVEDTAARLGVEAFVKLPIRPEIASSVDKGVVELVEEKAVAPLVDALEMLETK